jgi:hypothetical protein
MVNDNLMSWITQILIKDIDARDDWMSTIKQIHDRELQILSYDKTQYYDALFSNKLSNLHTIKRLWQLVQEKYPELRGHTWGERQRQGGMVAKDFAQSKYSQLSLF